MTNLSRVADNALNTIKDIANKPRQYFIELVFKWQKYYYKVKLHCSNFAAMYSWNIFSLYFKVNSAFLNCQ